MKAITIHQPWAWAVATGRKTVENRTWSTNYRGPLAIHAGISKQSLHHARVFPDIPQHLVYGALIAVVTLVDCVPVNALRGSELKFVEGPWCWMLQSPILIEPYYCAGYQGLWNPPETALCIQTRP